MTKADPRILKREQKLVGVLKKAQAPKTIRQLARLCFPGVRPIEKADSRVRNALRRPRADGLVKQVGQGTYALA